MSASASGSVRGEASEDCRGSSSAYESYESRDAEPPMGWGGEGGGGRSAEGEERGGGVRAECGEGAAEGEAEGRGGRWRGWEAGRGGGDGAMGCGGAGRSELGCGG